MLEVAPEAIDQALLNEVVDVLTVLDEKQDESVVDLFELFIVGVSILELLPGFILEVRPKQAAHTLDTI